MKLKFSGDEEQKLLSIYFSEKKTSFYVSKNENPLFGAEIDCSGGDPPPSLTSGTCRCMCARCRNSLSGCFSARKLLAKVCAILVDSFMTSPRFPVSVTAPSLSAFSLLSGRVTVVSMYSVEPPVTSVHSGKVTSRHVTCILYMYMYMCAFIQYSGTSAVDTPLVWTPRLSGRLLSDSFDFP